MNNFYQLSTLIIGVETLVMAITIWMLSYKKNDPEKADTKSMIFFSLAMLVMSAINLSEFAFGAQNNVDNKMTIVIFAASIELFLFMFAYLSILDQKYVSSKRIALELLLIIVFTLPPLIINQQNNPKLFSLLFYIALIFYMLKLTLNIAIYKKHVSAATEKLKSYYSEKSSNILKWINNSFFLVLTIGVVSTIVPISNIEVLLTYNIFLICAYMYLYALIIRNIYTVITKMNSIDSACQNMRHSCNNDNIDSENPKSEKYISEELYKQWLKNKLYTRAGITAEETAAIFCTNRSKLSQYLKNELNTNFYEWIAQLRIEDAKKELINYPDKLISDIALEVGIEDRSNFTRTFKKFTGFSPHIYRSHYLSQKSN